MTTLAHCERTDATASRTSRLLVTLRDPETRLYCAVGFLIHDPRDGYVFAYLRNAVSRPGFEPLPGLSRTSGWYRSDALFPIFAERVMSSRRPDRAESMAALDLPEDAAPFEVLLRSGGRRIGDTLELLPAPHAAANGQVSMEFLVHGVRHMPWEAQGRISSLEPGERLLLRSEPSNDVNSRAQLVTDDEHLALGYLPDPLLPLVERMTDVEVCVLHANDERVGYHFRLLARLTGSIPPGTQLFDGPDWALVSSEPDN